MLLALFNIVDMILQLAVWLLIAQVILSWLVAFNVLNTASGFVGGLLTGLDRLTAPLYRRSAASCPISAGSICRRSC